MIRIERTTAMEVFSNPAFPALKREYIMEAGLLELPDPQEKIEAYKQLDGSGYYHGLAAFEGDELVGFAAVLTPVFPHYGRTVATMESLFVASAHRKSGAGLKLIREAEKIAREVGAPAIMVSAPSDGRLERILPGMKYRHSATIYMKGLKHE